MAQCPKCGRDVPQREITITEPASSDEAQYNLSMFGYEPRPGDYIEYDCPTCGYMLEKKSTSTSK